MLRGDTEACSFKLTANGERSNMEYAREEESTTVSAGDVNSIGDWDNPNESGVFISRGLSGVGSSDTTGRLKAMLFETTPRG